MGELRTAQWWRATASVEAYARGRARSDVVVMGAVRDLLQNWVAFPNNPGGDRGLPPPPGVRREGQSHRQENAVKCFEMQERSKAARMTVARIAAPPQGSGPQAGRGGGGSRRRSGPRLGLGIVELGILLEI